MSKSDTITVYWGPGERLPYEARNNMLHRKPESLLSFIHGEKTPESTQQRCPAMKDRLNNVFVFKSAVNDEFDINLDEVAAVRYKDEQHLFNVPSKTKVIQPRPGQLNGYYTATYMMTWLLFASEPVLAKFTAPYYPAVSPVKGALLATGEYDIGRWFRPVALEYHIPDGENHFSIKENDPLMFVEFMTDKKIVFKRFQPDDILQSLAVEFANSPKAIGQNMTLDHRYDIADESEMSKLVLAQIKKNLV